MKKIIAFVILLVVVLSAFLLTTFAETYERHKSGVDFTVKYEDNYGQGIYYAFYYPEEGNSCYLSTDVSYAAGVKVVVGVNAVGINGVPYDDEVTYTSGSGYACAEIEPNAIYVKTSEHYAVRRVKSSNAFMDDFQATYN